MTSTCNISGECNLSQSFCYCNTTYTHVFIVFYLCICYQSQEEIIKNSNTICEEDPELRWNVHEVDERCEWPDGIIGLHGRTNLGLYH